jgi:hypothetical protein
MLRRTPGLPGATDYRLLKMKPGCLRSRQVDNLRKQQLKEKPESLRSETQAPTPIRTSTGTKPASFHQTSVQAARAGLSLYKQVVVRLQGRKSAPRCSGPIHDIVFLIVNVPHMRQGCTLPPTAFPGGTCDNAERRDSHRALVGLKAHASYVEEMAVGTILILM